MFAIVKIYITYIEAKGEVPKISILDMQRDIENFTRLYKKTVATRRTQTKIHEFFAYSNWYKI